jgi:lysozyme
MRTSTKGFDLIKSAEGLRLNAYPDPATGGEPWTIG